MNRIDVLNQIQVIIRNVLNDQSIILSENTSAEDVERWDSLNHMSIISSVEDFFKIKLSFMEMINLENVGSLVDIVLGKI